MSWTKFIKSHKRESSSRPILMQGLIEKLHARMQWRQSIAKITSLPFHSTKAENVLLISLSSVGSYPVMDLEHDSYFLLGVVIFIPKLHALSSGMSLKL